MKASLKDFASSSLEQQSNLSTMATLLTPKKWPLYICDHSVEVFQPKLLSKLDWMDLVWPLLTGVLCLEVAVNTGLTVVEKRKN